MKGDRVEVTVDTGGSVQTYELEATKAGRRLEVTNARGVIEVAEVTRTGQVVRTGRFMAARVIALVEHPAREPETPGAAARRRGRQAPEDQSSLLPPM
jgi:hypothetical protein